MFVFLLSDFTHFTIFFHSLIWQIGGTQITSKATDHSNFNYQMKNAAFLVCFFIDVIDRGGHITILMALCHGNWYNHDRYGSTSS